MHIQGIGLKISRRYAAQFIYKLQFLSLKNISSWYSLFQIGVVAFKSYHKIAMEMVKCFGRKRR